MKRECGAGEWGVTNKQMYITFQVFLANFSFLVLFLSMLIYWFQASFSIDLVSNNTKNSNLLDNKNLGSIGMLISNLSLFILLLSRWNESGHFPLSNLYESLMFLSWSLTLIHLIIEFIFNSSKAHSQEIKNFSYSQNYNLLPTKQKKKILINKLIGSITAPSALFTNAFATFSLPKEMQEAGPLVPALQSNWLMMHVTVMILSYAALILGSLLSIGFLVISKSLKLDLSSSKIINSNLSTGEIINHAPGHKNINTKSAEGSFAWNDPSSSDMKVLLPKERPMQLSPLGAAESALTKSNLAKTLDNLSYRILGLGFPLLTIGILSGAVWANEAWGSYWSWDPKETWALLTWLVFAIYLHTRLTKGWEGEKPALIASLGFVTVWICFLGVNLIGEGLHSYGWLS